MCDKATMSQGESASNLEFNIDVLGKLVSSEQEGDGEAVASNFAWYSDTFMIAAQSKDVKKMQGICDACLLVLDSIVDHESTIMCQSIFMSFLVRTKEHFPVNLFSSFRVRVLKLIRLHSWMIKEALCGNFNAKHFLEHLLDCLSTSTGDDMYFLQKCVVLSVEVMAGLEHNSLNHKSIECRNQIPSFRDKLVVLKNVFNAYVQCVELSSPKQFNFALLEMSRESSLKSLDCIVNYLHENALASSRSERTATTFSHRETMPTFSLYGDIIDFLSKALKVYHLDRLQDRTHIHFIFTLFINLFETSAKMNSVTFMGHAALMCYEQLLPILNDSQTQCVSSTVLEFLRPKLQQLQTGKISGLSYEAVISIALHLMPPSSECTELHHIVKSTALLMCNREANIP
jgi:hypothetical protein